MIFSFALDVTAQTMSGKEEEVFRYSAFSDFKCLALICVVWYTVASI